MKLGPLFIGWWPLTEQERIALDLDVVIPGWEALSVEWHGRGWMLCVRPREVRHG